MTEDMRNLKMKTFNTKKEVFNFIRQWGLNPEDISAIVPTRYVLGLCVEYTIFYWEEDY